MAQRLSAMQFVLLLHNVPQIGEKTLAHLLRLASQSRLKPEDIFTLSAAEWQRLYDVRPDAAEYLTANRDSLIAQSLELARAVRGHPLHVLTPESAAYPGRLERHDDAPPPILYCLGRLALLDAPPAGGFTFTIAVSNGAGAPTLDRQDTIAGELVRAGGIPVTGHDRAPYQRLALAAQRQDRPVIYVLDRGLRETFGPDLDRPPFAAARIRDAVFRVERDLALSPFRLDDHSLGANNRRRDRIVFSLSDLVVALDVRAGGVMSEECLRAQTQGRLVLVADGGRDGNAKLRTAGVDTLLEEPGGLTRVAAAARGELREARPRL